MYFGFERGKEREGLRKKKKKGVAKKKEAMTMMMLMQNESINPVVHGQKVSFDSIFNVTIRSKTSAERVICR